MRAFKSAGPILIVEDNTNIASLLNQYLTRDGFDTTIAQDGQEAINTLDACDPALVILDIMLPHVNGWQVCKHIRDTSDTPILMLTARESEADRIRGFSLGVDDYVVKPFSPREVVERVKAILRRTSPDSVGSSPTLCFGPLSLEPEKYRLSLNNQPIALTTSEYTLLYTLMRQPGRVYTRDQLLDRLNIDDSAVVDRVIDVHVGNIRQKIESDPSRPYYILTKRGVGYYFNDITKH